MDGGRRRLRARPAPRPRIVRGALPTRPRLRATQTRRRSAARARTLQATQRGAEGEARDRPTRPPAPPRQRALLKPDLMNKGIGDMRTFAAVALTFALAAST